MMNYKLRVKSCILTMMLISILATVSEGQIWRSTTCQGRTFMIACYEGFVIDVISASFGREANSKLCGKNSGLEESCFVPAEEETQQCEGKMYCSFKIRRKNFSLYRSCPSKRNNYLLVRYVCTNITLTTTIATTTTTTATKTTKDTNAQPTSRYLHKTSFPTSKNKTDFGKSVKGKQAPQPHGLNKERIPVWIPVSAGLGTFLIVVLISFVLFKRRRREKKRVVSINQPLEIYENCNERGRFNTYEEIEVGVIALKERTYDDIMIDGECPYYEVQ